MKIAKKLSELVHKDTIKKTSMDHDHSHEYKVDTNGDGGTTFTYGDDEHQHKIVNWKVSKAQGHTHEIEKEDLSELDK